MYRLLHRTIVLHSRGRKTRHALRVLHLSHLCFSVLKSKAAARTGSARAPPSRPPPTRFGIPDGSRALHHLAPCRGRPEALTRRSKGEDDRDHGEDARLALIPEGHPRHIAAARSEMDRQTLRDWVHRYNDEGVAGLLSIGTGGRQALLTPPQMAELKDRRMPPLMVKDNRHDAVHLYVTVCPARGVGAAIIMPAVDAEAMNEHLKETSTQVAAGAHAVAVLDGAGC